MPFTNLPEEINTKIFDLLDLSSLLKSRLVAKNWNNFFYSQESDITKKLFTIVLDFLRDVSIRKIITLSELEMMDELLLNDDYRLDLFISLKKLEADIIDIAANDLAGEDEEFSITPEEMQVYLYQKFGVAGLFHTYMPVCLFGYNSIEDRAKHVACFVALEKVIQNNLDAKALEFVNRLITEKVLKFQISSKLQFENNQLYLHNESFKLSVTEIAKLAFKEQKNDYYPIDKFNALINMHADVIMRDLEINSQKSTMMLKQ